MRKYLRKFQAWRLALFFVLILGFNSLLPALEVDQAQAKSSAEINNSLQVAFATASQEFGVPQNLLMAVSYNLSRWEDHHGAPSRAGGYGVMHLVELDSASFLAMAADTSLKGGDIASNPAFGGRNSSAQFTRESSHTLSNAARLLGLDSTRLKLEPLQNIRGGAALLAQYGRETVAGTGKVLAADDETEWYGAVAKFSGSDQAQVAFDFADTVYATLQQGVQRTLSDGQQLTLTGKAVQPDKTTAASLQLLRVSSSEAECPPELACEFIPAAYKLNSTTDNTDYGNYDPARREEDGLSIRYIVIHDTEVSYNATLQGFQNPLGYASSHYVLRAADGHIAQMVKLSDVAWHAGNWYLNTHAIGIEHEGVAIEGANWYSELAYRTSARLVRYLAARYHIPLDRAHILGHDELPGPTPKLQAGMHWDPGPFWDWSHYMELLGAPLPNTQDYPASRVVMLKPNFQTNRPAVTYCYKDEVQDCRDVSSQAANFVYLHTAPSPTAPLITNPYFPKAEPSLANNWANKAVTGQQFFLAERQGDWDAIYYSGQKAWFYNPCQAQSRVTTSSSFCPRVNSVPGKGMVVRPKAGLAEVAVYGTAYPDQADYPAEVTAPNHDQIYTIPAGQFYIAEALVGSDYYYAPEYTLNLDQSKNQLVKGKENYYQIYYNHRLGYVKASEVEVVSVLSGWYCKLKDSDPDCPVSTQL